MCDVYRHPGSCFVCIATIIDDAAGRHGNGRWNESLVLEGRKDRDELIYLEVSR